MERPRLRGLEMQVAKEKKQGDDCQYGNHSADNDRQPVWELSTICGL
jgi:hypothetical protein